MPADLRYEEMRAIEDFIARRFRSIARTDGVQFKPGQRRDGAPNEGMESHSVFLPTQAAGYDETCGLNIIPFRSDFSFVPLDAGTAAAGSASTLTLAATASAVDDDYNGQWLTLTAGTACGQIGLIDDYNGTTKVATMAQDWTATPDNTTEYVVGDYEVVMA